MEPEIGYHIWRDFWGRGYATEAASACRDHALHTLDRSRVVSITSRENVPSQRVAERVHQRREVFSKIRRATGLWIGRYIYIPEQKIGRAAGGERGCQSVVISG